MDKDPHIIVVGAGIIGSSIARHLARRGVGKVTVLEVVQMIRKKSNSRWTRRKLTVSPIWWPLNPFLPGMTI